jgi:hypothetical protein
MTDAAETNLGRKPKQLSADAGHCPQANLALPENRGIVAMWPPVGRKGQIPWGGRGYMICALQKKSNN